MGLRRRYEVVLVGEEGPSRSHRRVVSEHRSEREARTAAERERQHLELVRGEAAREWSVVVVRDGEVLAEERPLAGHDPPPGPEPAGAAAAPEPGGAPAPEPGPAEPAGAPEPEGEPPEGPVPEWVIRSFEEAIERRRARGDDSGGAG